MRTLVDPLMPNSSVALAWGLTSLAPFPLLGDLGIPRSGRSADPAHPDSNDTTAIIGATLTLWVLNLLLPALVGLIWQWRSVRNKKRMANLPL